MKENYFKYWIFIVLILQPIIDIIAFFCYDTNTLPSFILRSVISFFIVLYTFIKSKNKKKYILYMLPIIMFSIFHILNSYRVGMISLYADLRYIVSVTHMPILAIGLIDYIKDRKEYINQIKLAFIFNVILVFISVILSVVTNSYAPTYMGGYGITGWFSSANTHSMVLVAICPLFLYYTSKTTNNVLYLISHLIVFFLLFLNGTRACYLTLIVIYILMIYVSIFNERQKDRIIRIVITSIFIILVASLGNTSYTMMRQRDILSNEDKIKNSLKEEYIGIDLKTLSKETIIEILKNYEYWDELINYFGEDRIYEKMYDHLTIKELPDNRLRKKIYGEILFEDSDLLTKLVGFEYTRYSTYPVVDMENDMTAIFYYYGYIGFTMYIGYFLYFVYIILSKIRKDHKILFDGEFVFLCVLFMLLIFGSEYTGALLRKPNANIYFSCILVLIYAKCLMDDIKIKDNKITFLLLHLGFGGIETSTINTANTLNDKYDIEIISFYKLSKDQKKSLNKKIKVKYLYNGGPNREEFKVSLSKFNIFKVIKEGIKSIKIIFLKKYLIIKEIINSDSKYIVSTRNDYSIYLSRYGNNNTIKIAQEHRHHNGDEKYIDNIKYRFSNIDYLLALTNSLKNDYELFLKDNKHTKIVLIPNMIDIPKQKSNLNTDNLITISRLHSGKKIDELIAIFSKLDNKKNKLYIIGDGNEMDNLKSLINEKNLNDRVILTGYKTKEEMKEYIMDASVFVMTSISEALPMVLLEAMSYGIPCVAYKTESGVADIIDDGINGYIINNRNEKEYIKKLNELLKDKDKLTKLGKNAIDKANTFSKKAVLALWENVLDSE